MYNSKWIDNTYCTGSSNNLNRQLEQHISGFRANITNRQLPVDQAALCREKQVKGWSEKKKGLISGDKKLLHELTVCQNSTRFKLERG